MKGTFCFFYFFLCSFFLHAQDRGPWAKYVDRLEGFGKMIPQEKVYIHMDNTCYFLGDSIWFKAYLRQTNTDKPSSYSGTLYVELLNHDGYVMERKILEMKNGEGDGFFELRDDSTMYAGFYELRAYTRWQLNWGEFEHNHSYVDQGWFFNKATRHEFFRDYDKLYSRVFPVYNKPTEPGEYYLDMTLRPLERYYKEDDKAPKLTLNLYPEGGNLVAGVPNRVAYEAQRADGEYLKGKLVVQEDSLPVLNRGRGVFEVIPEKGTERSVEFVTKDGERVKAKLPKAEEMGVALSVKREGDEWVIRPNVAGLPIDSIALTVMHEGKLSHFKAFNELTDKSAFCIPNAALPTGVNQVTVFDTEGRVWADRLFFVASDKPIAPTVSITGTKNFYEPYEPIKLDVRNTTANASNVSLAVRESRGATRNYDTGNILTEMLLSSEIRGFVPDPGWFFEADDVEHRQALDLLMMTQGWRRFNWKDMAIKGEWEFVHPVEKTPVLTGAVHTYQGFIKYDSLLVKTLREHALMLEDPTIADMTNLFGKNDKRGQRNYHGKDLKKNRRADSLKVTSAMRKRMTEDGEKLRREVLVHGEFVKAGSENAIVGNVATKDGQFQITLPRFYDYCRFFLAASDTTKWGKDLRRGKRQFNWIVPDEEKYPEYYVRLSYPYPHFVKPYTHYQLKTRNVSVQDESSKLNIDDAKEMNVVNVKANQRGRKLFKYARPVLGFDAFDAYNMVVDAGLMDAWYTSTDVFTSALSRYHVADMGINGDYETGTAHMDMMFSLFDRKGEVLNRVNNEYKVIDDYNRLYNLDSVFIYTDYSPRMEGDKRYSRSNQPGVTILYKRFEDDMVRTTYRDRFLLLQGFAQPAEFYSPDYSKQTPPEGEKKDYRRTLYWNPRLKLDEQGRAHVTLYNNSRQTTIVAEAEGQAADGELLWSK